MADDTLRWAVPAMRAGYAGRGLVSLAVAGFSLAAVARGGEAEGTTSALARLERSPGGDAALVVIAVGLAAYAVWRGLDAAFDLDGRGSDAKGLAIRAGQAGSSLLYAGLALATVGLLLSIGESTGDESRLRSWVGTVMGWPAGRWLVALAGAATIGVGAVDIGQGLRASYERFLRASPFTSRWRAALRFGVGAHGVTISLVGVVLILAAWQADPSQAGGLAAGFDWLDGKLYGRALVMGLCVGLLAFALFCFVNARWRVVPRVAGDATETLAAAVRRLASA